MSHAPEWNPLSGEVQFDLGAASPPKEPMQAVGW